MKFFCALRRIARTFFVDSVNPFHKVYTVADHEKGNAAYATMTLEHNLAFVLSSDRETNGRYEALIENRL